MSERNRSNSSRRRSAGDAGSRSHTASRMPRGQEGRAERRREAARPHASRKGRAASRRRGRAGKKMPPAVRARMRRIQALRRTGVASAATVLALGSVVGLLFFARPTTSEVERRTLKEFPEFTLDGFLNGSFFSDVALWYSDTYPLREQMVSANKTIEAMHGIQTENQVVGNTKQADELPVEDETTASDGDEGQGKKEKQESVADRVERGTVEEPTAEQMNAAVQNQILDGLYVKGDAAYNIYYFSKEAVQDYAEMLSYLADDLKGKADVYSVVAPNASGVLLSEQEIKDLGGTNQADAIEYMYSLMSEDVNDVDVVSNLADHKDEYIYFRTDHHWTELGGYYAYEAFCKTKGIDPVDPDDLEHKNFGDFLGSFYGQLGNASMEAHPDEVEAWIPSGTNDMTVWDDAGNEAEYEVITDTSTWNINSKSMAFIMGDQPLEHIQNPDIDDGSSCLVIIDSFGCYFAPWLVDSYEDVWIADFRYYAGDYTDLIEENDIKDVIVLNNVSLAGGGVVDDSILSKW